MTEQQRKRLLKKINDSSAQAVADEMRISEVTLLRALLNLDGVHSGSLAVVDRYAAGLE